MTSSEIGLHQKVMRAPVAMMTAPLQGTTSMDVAGAGDVCGKCGGAEAGDESVCCGGCRRWWHWRCLDPVLTTLPVDDWFCTCCLTDAKASLEPEDGAMKTANIKKRKKKQPGPKKVSSVPETHRGHIPGIEVGQSWRKRSLCAQDDVHRAYVSGIHGSVVNGGAVSLSVNGGYGAAEQDHGDHFLYTGQGGLINNEAASQRNQEQIQDQLLERYNLALAVTCNAPVNKDGAIAQDWRKSKEIRVVRGFKLKSEYSPAEGFRYDGLYKLVRYHRQIPANGKFAQYFFELRRDDPTPRPWTTEGKLHIQQLGLQMIEEKRDQVPTSEDSGGIKQEEQTLNARGTEKLEESEEEAYVIPIAIQNAMCKAMSRVPSHQKIFALMIGKTFSSEDEFIGILQQSFLCPICQKFVDHPVTNICGHTCCLDCITRWVQGEHECKCPSCNLSLLASTRISGYGSSTWAQQLARQTYVNMMDIDKGLVHVFRLCLGNYYCTDVELDMPGGSNNLNDREDTFHMSSLIFNVPKSFLNEKVDTQRHILAERVNLNGNGNGNGNDEGSTKLRGHSGLKKQETLPLGQRIDLSTQADMSDTAWNYMGFREQAISRFTQHFAPTQLLQRGTIELEVEEKH